MDLHMSEPANNRNSSFLVKFWGTRGTRMVAGAGFSEYGRNTICVEVHCGQRVLIFDAGSGIVGLGSSLIERGINSFDLFLSHAHYDHVEGIPFFQPFYERKTVVNFWSGKLKGIKHTREIVDGLMKEPYFPIRQEKFHAKIIYRQVEDRQTLDLGDGIEVQTTRLHHPGGATGYRVNYAGKSFAFITDTTHAPGQRDTELVEFIRDVDLFAYDCSYTDEEFPQFASFGHSTWEEASRLRNAANAKRMMGLHHMPFRNDEALKAISARIERECSKCEIARDGAVIELN